MNKLIFGNLVHRPLRSMISALAIALEVVMILSIAAIMFGILNGNRQQQLGTGYDMIARPASGSAILATSSASASVKIADVLRGLPHVEVVAPVAIKIVIGTSVQNLFGIDYPSYNALKPFVYVAGGPPQGPYDLLVDDVEATNNHFHVDQSVPMLGHPFRIAGIVEHGKGARRYIPLNTLDDLEGSPGKASSFLLRTEDSPKYQQAVRQEILGTDGLNDWSVQTLEELLSLLTPEHVPGFNIAIRVVIGIAIVIGFMVIFQSMYTAVLERTREIGILKSMGAGKGTIVSVVLRETGVLAIVGVILGILATLLMKMVLHVKAPAIGFELTGRWVVSAAAITLLGALLGALYPALKAARKDPIDALAYE